MNRRDLLALGIGLFAGCGRPADDWLRETAFEDLAGKPRRLTEWRARVLVLNFWATWCAPCREEIPLLIAAADRYRPRGLEVIGIAIDLAANVAPYARSMAIAYPVLLAERGGVDLMRRLGNASAALPFTAFVDARGEVVGRKHGAFTAAELDTTVARLLA